jgi:hypothetical protein
MFFLLLFICIPHSPAQIRGAFSSDMLPGGHRGAITALLTDGYGNVFSAGEDGFVGLWRGQNAQERFQISPYGIRLLALRPGKTQIAAVKSDGHDIYRVSAWDYETRQNIFTLRFTDPISYINYSAAGGFLIVARARGHAGLVFIHSETGEILESPEALSGKG